MREIKFKAKRVDNGEWVEGYLTSGFKENQFYIDTCRKFSYEENSLEIYEVRPETVCQYTGLKDKNGKEIWEGDKVSGLPLIGYSNQEKIVGSVVFTNKGIWKVLVVREDWDEYEYLHHLVENKRHQLEVIGNIHDNNK